MSSPLKTVELISICCAIGLIIFLTVGGNLVVLFAFFNDPHLLTPSNNFILTMSIADLLVGLIGMPLYAYAQIKNSWPFGKFFCKIWITVDDVVTMASVLSIVAITIERYWSINHSLHYRRYTTKVRIRIFSILIWLIPFLNFAPGIWFLKSHDDNQFDNTTINKEYECIGAYHSHTLYLIIAQINFFAWPLLVIIVLNVLIVINLYKRTHRNPAFTAFLTTQQSHAKRKSLSKGQHQTINIDNKTQQQHMQLIDNDVQMLAAAGNVNCHSLNGRDSSLTRGIAASEKPNEDLQVSGDTCELQPIPAIKENDSESKQQPINIYTRFKHVFLSPPIQNEFETSECHSSKSTQTFPIHSKSRKHKNRSMRIWKRNARNGKRSSNMQLEKNINSSPGEQRTVRRLRRDKRAATSLFILVLVFMFFLLPYVVVVVVGRIFSLKALTNTHGQLYSAVFWLLWLNSTINPILYPFIQPRFRDAYRKLYIRLTRRHNLASVLADIKRTK